MIQVQPKGSSKTVIVFSGMSAHNYIYEWTQAFSNFPVNLISTKDPENKWYQVDFYNYLEEIRSAVAELDTKFLLCLGGSAGGFAALAFGKLLLADSIIAFCPQSACGQAKRDLGDNRWPEICASTPSFDIAGEYPTAEIHVGRTDLLDMMHARRIKTSRTHFLWEGANHDLPHFLKSYGHLRPILENALAQHK